MSNYNSNSSKNLIGFAPELPIEARLPARLGLDACPWLDEIY